MTKVFNNISSTKVVVPLVIFCAIITGVSFEIVTTDIDIELIRLPNVILLSPITLTVGGGHFCWFGDLRTISVMLGLVSWPQMIAVSILAWKLPTLASYLTLFAVVAFCYYGVIHKHLAVMSV